MQKERQSNQGWITKREKWATTPRGPKKPQVHCMLSGFGLANWKFVRLCLVMGPCVWSRSNEMCQYQISTNKQKRNIFYIYILIFFHKDDLRNT